MAMQIRRGTNAERQLMIPLQGELIFTTDTKKLYVGDGTTQGGIVVDTTGGGGVSDGNTTYTISAAATTGGVNLALTGSDSSTDNVKLAAGANVTITRTDADTITIASTGVGGIDVNTTYSISATTVAGGANIALAGSDATTDNLKLVAGANVTITRTDADTITIAATGGSGGGAAALDELSDVVIDGDTLIAGQTLVYDGTEWVNVELAEPSINLTALTDVNIFPNLADGDYLIYNSTIDSWVNDPGMTDVAVRNEASSMLTQGNHTGISFNYNLLDNTVDATVLFDSLDLYDLIDVTAGTFNGNLVNALNEDIIDVALQSAFLSTVDFSSFVINNTPIVGSYDGLAGVIEFPGINKEIGVNGKLVFFEPDGGIKVFASGTLEDENPPDIFTCVIRTSNPGVVGVTTLRSRGTYDDPLIVQSGDSIGGHYFNALSDVATVTEPTVASFSVEATGTITSTAVPGKFIISTADSTGTLNANLVVGPEGVLELANNVLSAGVTPGTVDTAAAVGYLKIVIGGIERAIPYYAINP